MNVPPNTVQPVAQSYERYRAITDSTEWRRENRRRHKQLQRETRKEINRARRRSAVNYAGNMTVARTINAEVPSAPSLRKKTPT